MQSVPDAICRPDPWARQLPSGHSRSRRPIRDGLRLHALLMEPNSLVNVVVTPQTMAHSRAATPKSDAQPHSPPSSSTQGLD